MKDNFKFLINIKVSNIVCVVVLFFLGANVFSQTYYNIATLNGQNINTCSGTFVDSGGAGGNYSDNESYSITFTSSNIGEEVMVTFTSFDIENNASCSFDRLRVYDGTNTSGTEFGGGDGYCGSTPPSTFISTTGSLHFVFTSDTSVTGAGWEATVSCKAPGDPILDLDTVVASNDYDVYIQPANTGSIFDMGNSVSLVSDSGTISSATLSVSGIIDTQENLWIDGTFFDVTSGSTTIGNSVSVNRGGGVFVLITQTSLTEFSIVRDGGGTIPAADFEELFQFDLGYNNATASYTSGVRQIDITVTDGSNGSSTQTTYLRVYAPVVAYDDVNSVSANNTGTISGDIITGGTPDDGLELEIIEVDRYPAMVGNTYTTLYGSITIQADGSYLYDVDETNISVLGLKNGASLDDIISYTVEGYSSDSDYGILIITINGVDDLPNAIDDTDSISPYLEVSTTGNVILDDTGGSSDTVDRGLSKLIWENEYVSGASVNGTSRTIDGIQLTFATSDPSGIADTGNHTVSYATNGGHTGYLRLEADGATALPHQDIVLTIDFDQPVYNLGFLMADLDQGGTFWQDLVRIEGSLDGVAANYMFTHTGAVQNPSANTFYGTGTANTSDATGNVNVFFDQPINQLKISYNYGPDVTNTDQGFQLGGISDIYWQSTTATIEVSEVDGNAANVGVVYTGTYGTIVVQSDGSYEYIVDTSNSLVANLLVGETLTETFTYTLSDGFATDTANLVITINGTGVDTDGDTVADRVDLDDDNDGILDVDELTCTTGVLSDSGYSVRVYDYPSQDTWGILSASSSFITGTKVGEFDYIEFANTTDAFDIDFEQNPYEIPGTDPDIVNYVGSDPAVANGTNDSAIEFVKVIDNIEAGTYSFTITNADDHVFIYKNGVKLYQHQNAYSGPPHVNVVTTSLSVGDVLSVVVVEEFVFNTKLFLDVTKTLSATGGATITYPCDTDGDGIFDHLDTDSDNDGCPDAIEGAGAIADTSLLVDLAGGSVGGSIQNLGNSSDAEGNPIVGGSGFEQANSSEVTDNSISTACTTDLKLGKTVDNALPKVGTNIKYTISVVNNGGLNATGVNVVDVLPPTVLTYVGSVPSQGTYDNVTGVWTIGTINVGETKTLEITVTVAQAGTIINTAQISLTNETDIDSTPNNGS